jgi:hypothetical protein
VSKFVEIRIKSTADSPLRFQMKPTKSAQAQQRKEIAFNERERDARYQAQKATEAAIPTALFLAFCPK